ncbi:response regulator [Stenotrophomonas sp. S41]|uniref:response regulator n=1 Tax=Stenotrophomonas sp. S41 TaxID=2767464 RepID=UPI00190D1D17|nr:response regulator [Stenotrophomonas sp. S41]MBK0011584.1 response regulator [Stenotrophomonas sp. S41]
MNTGNGDCILVVEDEPELARLVQDYLHASGYRTEWVADGAQVMAAYARVQPALVLLDLMLPNRDGIALCRDLRAVGEVPVIMVTARVEEVDRLLGLEVGADDYICKPFSPREMVARVGAVLRRAGARGTVAAGPAPGLQLDEPGGRASLHGQSLDLTPVEFRLLRTLTASPGRIWSRDQLMDHLYADHRVVADRTVDSHVRNLRRKLMDGGGSDWIKSIYSVGFRWDA